MFDVVLRPAVRALSLGVVLILATACTATVVGGEPTGGGSGSGVGDPNGGVVGKPADPGPAWGSTAARVVVPEPGIINPIPHTFDHVSIAADGRTATIYYYGGVEDCYGLADASIDRNDEGGFTVTVLEGARAAAAGQACIDLAELKAVTVIVDVPLFVPGGAAQG